jgi:hypothetical protein
MSSAGLGTIRALLEKADILDRVDFMLSISLLRHDMLDEIFSAVVVLT